MIQVIKLAYENPGWTILFILMIGIALNAATPIFIVFNRYKREPKDTFEKDVDDK